ncbi:L-ribulokinase [Spinactinospora alkalitolerans]|uniref:Ribulokinase n=1 Tax=Spinactinospora alkalitolerans TaxID=687207 RepID=A0A852TYG7_9ACTN|nr:ribulokinase [Spinactinospora alkalitolerans]NYE49039.1 L-ribulokinase [Spinactinospora alkalitolerans]
MPENVSANNPSSVVVGIDFGTLSGRAVAVRVSDGAELGTAVHHYEHGVISERLPGSAERLPPDTALQSPEDYREVLRRAVPKALAAGGIDPARVIGVGIDFTACTVLPATVGGTPLCELPGLAGRPHAYPKLWKHHAAQPEADLVNAVARERGEPWLARYGGRISSEWQFAKALQVLREDPELYDRADRWIEAADWIVWQLCGSETRNVCTAGYKGIHQDGAWPSRDYLAALDPRFADFVADKLAHPLSQLGGRAGGLTAEAAAWTGLPEGTAVAVGNVDAHVTAAAAQTVAPGQMLAVMGTSTCHVMNSDVLADVPGMCGVVRDGIVPGLWGYEAGQSGVGDIFGWFADTHTPAGYADEAAERGVSVHELLSAKAAEEPVGGHGLVALDWHSGNRSVLVDHDLSGVIAGMTLATRPEEVYRALVEATAFGTRTIVAAFEDSGVPVTDFTVAGGLVRNPFVMQIYADVLRRPLNAIGSDQGPAVGAAIHAAVAAGAHPDIHAASRAMGEVRRGAFRPDPTRADAYDELYAIYTDLHDHFGRGGSDALHRLRRIRNEAAAS